MDPRARLPRRIRSVLLSLVLLLPLALAGCLGGDADPQENQGPTPGTGATPTAPAGGGDPANDTGQGAFLIEDLRILPLGEDETRALHEDDQATVNFTVRHPGTPASRVTRFVTFVLDGDIVDVQQVSLEVGESKDFGYLVGPLHGRETVQAEVRVAPTTAQVEVGVEEWPRTRDSVQLGNLTLRVNRWLKDEADGSTLVNVTFTRPTAAENLTGLRAKILCADEQGKVTLDGEARPPLPAPGEDGTQDLRLPGCPHTLYGVRFKADDGGEVEMRVLFVERGWTPPQSPA